MPSELKQHEREENSKSSQLTQKKQETIKLDVNVIS
jgi:hypothetical protein